jgi:hypothetical protein
MRDVPHWFKGLVWVECFLQLPFFLFATYAFIHGGQQRQPPAPGVLAAAAALGAQAAG